MAWGGGILNVENLFYVCVCAGGGVQIRLSFFSLLYGTPAPSSERKHPESWPASTYGHLREGYLSVPCELMYLPI